MTLVLTLFLAGILLKLHDSVDQSEKSEILAHANVNAGMNLGAMLTHKNVARQNRLATELFHAKSLTGTVAPVA